MDELYINGELCDTAGTLNVRLNRKLIDPAELNTKDAQYSYSITLPATGRNNRIFDYAHIEETRDKFNRTYRAELIINGFRIFSGLFRLSEVSAGTYKGNLYLPTAKTIKEIFGDVKMNENPPYYRAFFDFAASATEYNEAAARTIQPMIFPYALYGVLPKVPAGDGTYSPREVWDETVRVGLADIPPSPNVLIMLRHFFESRGYNISGSAFSDERLKRLYMSYRNATDYVQPWNYGRHAKIRLRGEWSNVRNMRIGTGEQLERGSYEGDAVYTCDLFNANNTRVEVIQDTGGNVLYEESPDERGRVWANCQVRIPVAGFYKVRFSASLRVDSRRNWWVTDNVTGAQFVGGNSDNAGNQLWRRQYEVKLLRDFGRGDFVLSGARLDGVYYRDNLRQQYDVEGVKYFPPVDDNGQILFIDKAQNANHVLGFTFGQRNAADYKNPEDTANKLAAVQVAKPALSWDSSYNDDNITRLAVNSPGYRRHAPAGVDEAVDPAESTKYKINLSGVPQSYARRGRYDGAAGNADWEAQGDVSAVVWFNAGELLTLVSTAEVGQWRPNGQHSEWGWTAHQVKYDLSIQPFRTDSDWLKVDFGGNGTGDMNWNDPANFDEYRIDLVKFLPADIKTDDFIDNLCKAFNLQLSQSPEGGFTLNVKQSRRTVSNQYVDLDGVASVAKRTNTPLGLPSRYKLGFTVDTEEEGYAVTGNDGGGTLDTGTTEEKTVEQKSTFSYNWFKTIRKAETNGRTVEIEIPVISKAEVWRDTMNYKEAMTKRYTNQALRLWYYGGLLNDKGATFSFNGQPVKLAQVTNTVPGLLTLSYENRPATILTTYFTVLVGGASHYTEIEGYLSPLQYAALDGTVRVRFNGDMYYVAEVSGYDPSGKNKTKLKLIRQI